jgi:hypothetical protein
MTPDQLDELSKRHATFKTTALYMHDPRTDLDRWRHDWGEINRLVEEVNRLLRLYR